MQLKLKNQSLILLVSIMLAQSCTYKKNLIYFNGNLTNTDTNKNYSPLLLADDLLSITVIGLEESATKPFNLPISNLNQNLGGYTQGAPSPPGYLIDNEGYMDFHVVGKLKLAGLTRSAAIEVIKESLKPY